MDDVDGSVAVGIPVRGGAAARTNERPKSGTALKAMLVVLVIMCIVLSVILAHVMYDRPHHPAPSRGAKEGVLMRGAGQLITADPIPGAVPSEDQHRWVRNQRLAKRMEIESAKAPPSPPPPSPPPPVPEAPVVVRSSKPIMQITREALEPYIKDNLIIVTWGNHFYLDFVITWTWHLEQLGVKNYIVGAMDKEMMAECEARGIPSFAMNLNSLTTKDFGWGSPTFHKMGRQKIALIQKFVSLGVNLLLSDVDVLYMRDPTEFINRHPGAEVLTSSDHLASTTPHGDEGLEKFPQAGGPFNIGIMYFKATPEVTALAVQWSSAIEKDPNLWDQNAFNDIVRRGSTHSDPHTRLWRGYNGKVAAGVLPVSLFGSGHTFFVQRMHEAQGVKPFAVHATFQFCGTEGKRHRMREFMLWRETDPLHWDPPGGLLWYDPQVPPALIQQGGQGFSGTLASTNNHFKLVNFQLRQIRDAMAVASALGRTLIMPQLWCGLDRVWFPHGGVFPGSQGKLPFLCPLDHVLEVNIMEQERDENYFGPHINFREFSFLDNPQLPPAVKSSQVEVGVCEGGNCGRGAVQVPAGLTDAELREHFKGQEGVKVLKFTSFPVGVFGGFADPKRERQFVERLKLYGGPWGQVRPIPGQRMNHIWYDLFWDRAPHQDRFGRMRRGPWKPIVGDGGRGEMGFD